MWKSIKFALGMGLIASLQTGAGAADLGAAPLSIRGFASAGYIASTGNNYYGKTLHGGALDYYEVGANAFHELNANVSLAGQVMSRKAGSTDNGAVRVDYGFVDIHTTSEDRLGVRIGRVKNPMGFYNEARDVLSTRPSILLPQSIYNEGIGVRELLFSSDGVQFYGDHSWDASQNTAVQVNWVASRRAGRQTERNFAALAPGLDKLEMHLGNALFAQAVHQIDEGRQRYGLTYIRFPSTIALGYQGRAYDFSAKTQLFLMSAQYNSERWSLTGEARYTKSKTQFEAPLRAQTQGHSHGAYLQLDYRLDPGWTTFVRRDVSSRSTEQGSNSAGVGHDTVLGMSWQPDQAWRINVEYHQMRGQGMVPPGDNVSGRADKTRLLAVMAGYQF